MGAPQRLVGTFSCFHCGVQVTKRYRASRGLPKFCERACYFKWKKGKEPAGWLATPDRKREAHHAWKGDSISRVGGRKRALKWFPARPCERCGAEKAERHHKDDNTANNEPSNIRFLCRRCHMTEDGRIPGPK